MSSINILPLETIAFDYLKIIRPFKVYYIAYKRMEHIILEGH
jgi:hypothetical protein